MVIGDGVNAPADGSSRLRWNMELLWPEFCRVNRARGIPAAVPGGHAAGQGVWRVQRPAGAEFCPAAAERDHLGCARLLLEVGSVPDPEEVEACGDEDLVELLRERLDAIA